MTEQHPTPGEPADTPPDRPTSATPPAAEEPTVDTASPTPPPADAPPTDPRPAERSSEDPTAEPAPPAPAPASELTAGSPAAAEPTADHPTAETASPTPAPAEHSPADQPAAAERSAEEPRVETASLDPAPAEQSPAATPAGQPAATLEPVGSASADEPVAGRPLVTEPDSLGPAASEPTPEPDALGPAFLGGSDSGTAADQPVGASSAAGRDGASAEPTETVGDAATERIPEAAGGATWSGDGSPGEQGGATAAGFPAGGVPPSSGPWAAFSGRRLARSSQRKVIAGVAGGLGEYTGIDPVLFRVLFAVLTLFGGSGILLYVVGWLFMPAEDEQSSPVESLLHRGPGSSGSNRARDAVAAAALVIAGLVLAGVLAIGDARDLALVLVVVGGAFFLVRNLQERRDGGPPQPVVPEPTPPPPAPYETPLPTYQPPPVAYQPPAYPPVEHAAPTVTLPPPPAPAPRRRREHSALGMITICLLLVVLGVAAALTASGAIDPEADDLLAVAVGTIGAGLLVGAWFGRARWLTWLGIPLLIALIVLSTSNVSLKGGVGDRQYTPQTAAQIQPEYRIGVGSIRLDLSDVDLGKQLVRTKVSAGVGNIQVIVPRSADVSIDARAGIGEVDLLGQTTDGTSATRSVVDYGPGGDQSLDLDLDLDVSIGRVEVDRASA